MSFIDTLEHSYVGNFAGLPVYHPLEKTTGDEFDADVHNLVIGGGSGEHPGLVIKNLDACVYDFLEFNAEFNKKDLDKIAFFDTWFNGLTDDEAEGYRAYNNLDFAYWGIDEIANFTDKVKKIYTKRLSYYDDEEIKKLDKTSTENIIQIMLGEFVYFSAHHLISEKLRKHILDNAINAKELEHGLKEIDYVNAIFYPIKVTPNGYPAGGGKYFEYKENGQITSYWGLKFEEENLVSIVNSAREGNIPAIKYLLERGSDKHIGNDLALLKAIENNQVETIEYLMTIGLKINNVNDETVRNIVKNGHVSMLEFLKQQSITLNYKNIDVLSIAIHNKKKEMVEYLLEKKVEMNIDALKALVSIDDIEMTEVLLAHGADIDYIREHAGNKIALYLKNKEATELTESLEKSLSHQKSPSPRRKM